MKKYVMFQTDKVLLTVKLWKNFTSPGYKVPTLLIVIGGSKNNLLCSNLLLLRKVERVM